MSLLPLVIGLVLMAGLVVVFFVRAFLALKQALVYSYGLHEFARSIQVLSGQIKVAGMFEQEVALAQYPGWSGPLLNRHVHLRELATPSHRAVTTPNNDTLYTSAILELSQGPVEVVVPDSSARYVSVALMDMFHDQVAYIGTRATRGEGGCFWLVGPGQEVEVPTHAKRLDLPSNDLWLLARVFVAGDDDLEAARQVQSQLSVRPVDENKRGRPFVTKATSVKDTKTFVTLVNELLGRSPLTGHSERARDFAGVGIRPGSLDAFAECSLWQRMLWSVATSQLEARILQGVNAQQQAQTGWMVPPPILGQYGENDEVRAGVAMVGFGALSIEEAMYFRAITDADGAPLDGRRRYRMTIPKGGVPVQAFWSLSMYAPDEDDRLYFYDNELNRYAINSASDALTPQPNGEIVLALQRERPDDPSLVWMPTPEGPFQAIFRTYLPEESLKSGAWSVPPITIVQ